MIGNLVVGGIKTARINRQQLTNLMIEDCMGARLGRRQKPRVLIASNGSVIARYHSDKQFRCNVDQADLVDADGMPLVLASRIFCRAPLAERVATTDFINDAAVAAAKSGLRFYFLGGKPGVAETARDKLMETYPGLQVVGTQHGYFSDAEIDAVCADILEKKTDVLWIGLGSPRQEALAIQLRDKLPEVGWIRTCGGLFDHVSEAVPRATQRMQSMGLEWLHRMMVEPRRLAWRYVTTNPVACFHLLTKTFDWVEPDVGDPMDALGV
jgi:N-acetylglucosaminyldiphosphoundecaprenol N-acetyl-beta-D-mannosaminyltransferase